MIITKITKMNKETQNKHLRIFAKVDTSTKLQILKEQKNIFHKFKNNYKDIDKSVLTLSSLILAIQNIVNKFDNTKLNIINLQNKIRYRKQTKKDKLLSYFAIVKTLKKSEKMSYRDIAKYLKKYHKLDVSYSSIYKIYCEIEKNKKGEQ